MDHLREQIYLAALLHDIGKFYQRADDNGALRSKELDPSVKENMDYYCPKTESGYSHKHVLWTAQFIEDLGIHLKSKSGSHEDTLIKLAASHHNPSTFNEKIIQLADHMSAGLDRTEANGLEDEKAAQRWDSFKKVRLKSVFEAIFNDSGKYKYELPVSKITLEDTFFPKKNIKGDPDYRKLWDNFVSEVKFIQTDNYKVFAETFLQLLYKYTCNIPSSTVNLPDVSLYDHLKTTAAFALCLYDLATEHDIGQIAEIKKIESTVLLVGGDVSGIQTYIYDILSKNAAKNLKGRSFYIQLFTDSIVQLILNELNLFSANVVYSSGGSFYLLAPNSETVKDKLKKLKNNISNKIFNKHGTAIYLSVDFVEINKEQIFKQKINKCWKDLTEKLNKQKRQRHKDRLKKEYDEFFEPIGIGGNIERDAMTGEEILPGENTVKIDNDQKIKLYTHQQIELGKKLKKADFWISSDEKITYWGEKECFEICDTGIFNYFICKEELLRKQEKFKGSYDKVRIYCINDLDFLDNSKGIDNINGFTFYGGNDYPVDEEGSPLTFDKLAGEGEFKRLGILRLDVDNLGQTFIEGFKDEKRTFSRYSALSRNLDYFFKGYLNAIYKKEKYKNNTYIIYSGGDDLFIVGKWDVLIEMACEIQKEFRAWTCWNQKITLSGGIAIVDDKFPVMKGAKEAEDAENMAKNYLFDNVTVKKGKNAFSLMGYAISWDEEYPEINQLKDEIRHMLEEERLPKSFVSKVYSHYTNAKIKEGKLGKLNILWMMTYDLGRMKKRIKDENAKRFLDECKENVYTNSLKNKTINTNYHFLELLNLATRWAELEIRTNLK